MKNTITIPYMKRAGSVIEAATPDIGQILPFADSDSEPVGALFGLSLLQILNTLIYLAIGRGDYWRCARHCWKGRGNAGYSKYEVAYAVRN
jgi:hypothetical protein